jgi:arginyl-tRNA--protein-N-Asp/Glu arginylyltransferase
MTIQLYNKPEEIKVLQDLMQIREVLTRIESPVRGKLTKLSEEQYNLYVQYLDMLHNTADELEEMRNETTVN